MFKTTLKIDGMACGMCEAHVNDAVRNACRVKKVTSSHRRGCTEIISEMQIPEKQLHQALEGTGYRILEISSEPYEKKGFWKR